MSFIVTGRDIPANCFRCPLDKGVWKQEQDPFILCRYTKEIVRYDDVPTDRRLPCCGLKEMPEKHGRLGDLDELESSFRESIGECKKWIKESEECGDTEIILIARQSFNPFVEARLRTKSMKTIVEAEGDN